MDMAKGYSVLANQGKYSNKTCITSIKSQYDGEIYKGSQADERIFTEDTAYMVTDVLKGTLDKPYGTGSGLGIGVPAAGKTGHQTAARIPGSAAIPDITPLPSGWDMNSKSDARSLRKDLFR